MNYQDVTPEYLVYNATAGATDAEVSNQNVVLLVNGVGPFATFNYGLIQSVNGGLVAPAAVTPAEWTIDTGVPVANTTYSVNILQIIDGVALERQISYTTPAAPVANDAAIGLAAIINKLLSVGTFELASATQLLNVVTVVASATNPTFIVSPGSNVTVVNTVTGVPAVGQGSDLVGIVGINGVSPLSGSTYSTIKFDYQSDRIGLEGASRFERNSLIVLIRQGLANTAALEAQINDIIGGTELPVAEYIALV